MISIIISPTYSALKAIMGNNNLIVVENVTKHKTDEIG